MADPIPSPQVLWRLARLLARHGRTSEITVQGKSMGPLFAQPTRVVVLPGTSHLRPGDVVVYLNGGTAVAHRLLWVRRRRGGRVFIAMGDANYSLDPPVPESAVVGRVLAVLGPDGLQPLPRQALRSLTRYAWVQTRHLVPWRLRKLGEHLSKRYRR